MNKLIGILDYGMGNLNSVFNALNHLGYDGLVVQNGDEIKQCSHLIIPGVGSYDKAMSNLTDRALLPIIYEHAASGKPLLGICLGMQILSSLGEEGESSKGLDLIPGNVALLNPDNLPVPHVGWNSLDYHFDHVVFANLKKHIDFYFVHSYFFNATDPETILATTQYGNQFPAVVVKNNIVGVQFHPEKSQDNGLTIIENFCEWDGSTC